MTNKTIALLLASLAAVPAFAQSNVTVYGRADYGLMNRSGDSGAVPKTNGKTEFASGIDGPSRLGFKGTEDLGGGLKAIYELEYSLAVDNGAATTTQWGNRHSWVGLEGSFGTVIGGRIDGLRYGKLFGKFDPFHGLSLGNFGQLAPMIDRYDNSVMYTSTAYYGVTARLAYSSQVRGQEGATASPGNTHGGNDGDNRMLAAALAYDQGPLSLGASYERYRNQGLQDSKLWFATLGASYDFGVAKISALYDQIKSDAGNALVPGHDQTSWMIGAAAPFGSSTELRAMYGRTSYDKFKGARADGLDAYKWALGARYKLSKRTNFYVDFGSIHNDSNGFTTLGNLSTSYQKGYGTRGFDLGITHKF